jgi:hypothetical protein
MKKSILILIAVFLLLFPLEAQAALISFINDPSASESIEGVDILGLDWSDNNTTKNIMRTSLSLLHNTATLSAYSNNDPWLLTHRGTRGLGILGQEEDEIDSYSNLERIEVSFNNPVYIKSFEVRSLFYEPNLFTPGTEYGQVAFYNGSSNVFTQAMAGIEDIRLNTKGIVNYTYSNMHLIDKLVFYVPQGQCYTPHSEFALAKIEVCEEVPEPATMFMLFSFISGLFGFNAARKR